MSSALKNTATFSNNLTGSIRRGQLAIGVSGSFGPSSTTGWYNGPNYASGKYQIITNGSPADPPQVFCPKDDNELILFAKTQGATGANTGSVAAVLAWIANTGTLTAVNFEYESIVTDGLVLNLDAGFVASYPTTGTSWYDWSGNANNGTLTNGPTFNSANSGSIVFDGGDDYGVISNSNSINLTGSLTLFCWIYPSSISGWIAILYKNSQSNNGGYHMGIDPSGYLQGGIRYNSNWVTIQSSTNQLQINTWQQICMSIDFSSQVLTLYKNGVSIKTQNNFNYTLVGNTTPLYIGSNASVPSELYSGRISISQVYNRSLSAAEVLQNYNAQKGRFGL